MTIIIADASTLGRALREVASVVTKADSVPILSHVLIEPAGSEAIRITGTDLTKRIERIVKADVNGDGAFAVEASRFAAVVSTYSGDVKLSAEPGAVIVTSKRSRFRFATLTDEQYPEMPFGPATASFTASADFVEALTRTRHAHGTNEMQSALMGTYIVDRDGMEVVALDANRMALARLPMLGVPATIIPSATVDLIAKLASGDFAVELADGRIRCNFGDVILTSKLIDAQYPDYARIVPTTHAMSVIVDGDEMRTALGRLAMVAEDKERKVRLVFEDGKLTIALDTHRDQATEELPCDHDGDRFEMAFRAAYLRDALGAIDADQVTLQMNGERSPMQIVSNQRPGVAMIAMPVFF